MDRRLCWSQKVKVELEFLGICSPTTYDHEVAQTIKILDNNAFSTAKVITKIIKYRISCGL